MVPYIPALKRRGFTELLIKIDSETTIFRYIYPYLDGESDLEDLFQYSAKFGYLKLLKILKPRLVLDTTFLYKCASEGYNNKKIVTVEWLLKYIDKKAWSSYHRKTYHNIPNLNHMKSFFGIDSDLDNL